jgi:hypothetical protein
MLNPFFQDAFLFSGAPDDKGRPSLYVGSGRYRSAPWKKQGVIVEQAR